jgi:trigger factor
MNEEFFRLFNVADEAGLREDIRQRTLAMRQEQERERLRDETARFLLDNTTCHLPESLVAQETNLRVRDMVRRGIWEGATREQIAERRDEILQAAQTSSADRVKLSYILARIAEEERIEVTPAEIEARVKLMASASNTTPEALRAELEKENRMESVVSDIRGAKALDFVLENAKTA